MLDAGNVVHVLDELCMPAASSQACASLRLVGRRRDSAMMTRHVMAWHGAAGGQWAQVRTLELDRIAMVLVEV